MDVGEEVLPVGWSLVKNMGLDQYNLEKLGEPGCGERRRRDEDLADRGVMWESQERSLTRREKISWPEEKNLC